MDVNMKFLLVLLLLATNTVFAKWSLSTYNIRNFDRDHEAGATNIAELEKILLSVKSDVMGFQEIVNTPAFEKVVRKTLSTHELVKSSCGGYGKQHLALLYNKSAFELVKKEEDLSYTGTEAACGSLRPLFLVTLKQKKTGEKFIFGLVHLKAGGDERAFRQRWAQYKKLRLLSGQYEKANLILLGDFNTTGYNIRNVDYEKFEDFLSSSGMRTVSEQLTCTTYWHGADQSPNMEPSLLDHIVMSDSNYGRVQQIKLGAHCGRMNCRSALPKDLGMSYESVSDHCPIQVTFK